MIKAILFDMDGVLIEAKDWHYDALNLALSHFGFTISRESHLTTFDGLPTRQKLQMLTEASGLPLGLHELINTLKQSYTISISYQRCKPFFSHQYALSRLKREGYKIAVCSNSIRHTIDTLMELSGLASYIDFIVSNEDVEYGKPNPQMYLDAMNHFSLSPEECLILEDNEHGIQAARASGGKLLIVDHPADVTYHLISSHITHAL